MATKRKKQNSKESTVKNGVNVNNSSKKSKSAGKKKQRQQQQFMNENDYRLRLQEVLFSSEYILKKIFRKDGPPLGVEFDSMPETGFQCCEEGVLSFLFGNFIVPIGSLFNVGNDEMIKRIILQSQNTD